MVPSKPLVNQKSREVQTFERDSRAENTESDGNIDGSTAPCDSLGDKRRLNQNQQNAKRRRRIENGCKNHHDAASYLAETYFNKVKRTLSSDKFDRFIRALCEHDDKSATEVELYSTMKEILSDEEDLAHQFLVFLKPQQAMEWGKYSDCAFLHRAWTLFNSIDSHHFAKMLNILEGLTCNSNVKVCDIECALRPLFKGQANIVQAVCQLFGSSKSQIRDTSEYETVLDISTDNKDIEYEHVWLPRSQTDRSCPGLTFCKCPCHSTPSRLLCSSCNIRFINGRIYVQSGKEMRAAKVHFSYGVKTEDMQRKLHPLYLSQQQSLIKQAKLSPNKGDKKDKKAVQCEFKNTNEQRSENGNKYESKTSDCFQSDKCIDGNGIDRTCLDFTDAADNVESLENQVVYEENSQGYLEFYKEDENDIIGSEMMMERCSGEELSQDDETGEYTREPEDIQPSQIECHGLDNDKKQSSDQLAQFKEDNNYQSSILKDILSSNGPEDKIFLSSPLTDLTELAKTSDSVKDKQSRISWTREEDKVILEAFQQEIGTEHTFSKISSLMPSRSVNDIQERFHALMRLLEQIMSTQDG